MTGKNAITTEMTGDATTTERIIRIEETTRERTGIGGTGMTVTARMEITTRGGTSPTVRDRSHPKDVGTTTFVMEDVVVRDTRKTGRYPSLRNRKNRAAKNSLVVSAVVWCTCVLELMLVSLRDSPSLHCLRRGAELDQLSFSIRDLSIDIFARMFPSSVWDAVKAGAP
ncbi:hypothetical protein KGM_208297 [Danaus plexippus plexippus]|uniref:Uncharacterized protein n=1 Tax=Danaus plexippus plexippus TaxID=278856 RepID=A0A212FN78_DANPL|nr:hypothetical protein KGM_208297 [Danaus plexippus plexippus]